MNFTDSPFERMMKEVPRPIPNRPIPAPKGSRCHNCGYWRGMICVGICYRRLKATGKEGEETSGQLDPKSPGKKL